MFKIHITLVVVAAILLLAAVRTFLLLSERRVVDADADRRAATVTLSIRIERDWLPAPPALASSITSGAIVAMLNDVFEPLQPVFVRHTLSTDSANNVYVFAPGLIGTVVAVLFGPLLVRWAFRESWASACSPTGIAPRSSSWPHPW